jgi:uncharacterized protein YecE (DUF72 family)
MKPEPASTTPSEARFHVGTMGWSYADWNGVFYPDNSESRDWLSLYARAFDTVEIDSTFYGTPRESAVQNWSRTTPENFVFCSKVPRLITHEMGLHDVAEPLSEFVKAMAGLGPKRGPMLFQMPPDFTRDQLHALRALLPTLRDLADPDARFAIEFRHASLLTADVFALLKEHNVALAATDYAGMPRRFASTADFAYVRLIGKHGAFDNHRAVIEDRSEMVRRWASVMLRHQSQFREAWIFCNNDYEGFSPATGWKTQEALGLPTRQPASELQGSLF